MKRLGVPVPDKTLTALQMQSEFISLMQTKPKEERVVLQSFLQEFMGRLLLLEKGYCVHGYENWDDCPDCRH